MRTATLLKNLAGVLGLLQRDADVFLQGDVAAQLAGIEFKIDIDQMVIQRHEAKKAKNFAEADRMVGISRQSGPRRSVMPRHGSPSVPPRALCSSELYRWTNSGSS